MRWCLAIAVMIGFVVVLFFVGLSSFQKRHPGPRIKAESQALLAALESYRVDHGALPTADQVVIFRELTGANGKGKVYIEWPANRASAEGRFLDPLGHPYLFAFNGERITVSSPGRDGEPGGGDDFVGASR